MILDNILNLEIEVGREQDVDELMGRYHQCQRALTDFLACKISFQGYCDVLEFHGIEMDEYLAIIGNNLEVAA